MQNFLRKFLPVLLLFVASVSMASHIRAIEITIKRISSATLTYEFTVTGYRDVQGVNFSAGEFDFGDGSVASEIPWTFVEFVGNDTEKWQFVLTHTYQAARAYRVSYKESFRNAGIINMSNSGATDYYTETLLIIDPLIEKPNNTPVLTVPPIDLAATGVTFIHNPGAFDEDGDSLSYRLSTPLQDRGVNVAGYKSLIDPSFYDNFNEGNQEKDGPPTLELDSVTGDLIWDAPGEAGEYNVAFVVEEWRKVNGVYFPLGYVTRDMQIIVEDTDNEPPEVTPPDELCVAAGTLIDDSVYDPDIVGTDPDGHDVTLSAFGGPFEVTPSAVFSPDPPQPQPSPGTLDFEWQTDCSLIRERPYEVQIKVEDNPPQTDFGLDQPKLVDFEKWDITIVGPAPEGLMSTSLPGRRVQLEWDSYACPNTGAQMQVWRRVGEFPFDPENCEIGIPENAGYELISTLPIDTEIFVDNNDGIGLAPGANYCYRLVAVFPDPLGGESYASIEVCEEIEAKAPLITKVDIQETDESNGDIRVEWIDPLDLDEGMFPGPYTYDVLRTTGLSGQGEFSPVATGLSDQFYDDSGLNTTDDAYSYKIILYDNTSTAVDTSFAASSVRLELKPQVGAMNVTWDANVPWSNSSPDFVHDVYRDNVNPMDPDELVLIASVDVTQSGLSYLDDGSHNGEELDQDQIYCYFVTARGTYDNSDTAVPEPLENNSQIQCAQPKDEIPPCTPVAFAFDPSESCEVLFSTNAGCDFDDYRNKLNWELDMNPGCGDDVVSFNIYFSETGDEGTYELLENTTATTYTHLGLDSFKGCYKVSAVDRSGNESELSEAICNENCIFNEEGELTYVLPNVFTPNGDGINDTFRPFGETDPSKCPRFVESVDFEVFDRSGKTLFTYNSNDSENDIFINWDGSTDGGKELPPGTYFYSAEVIFDTLDEDIANQQLKGWVQILR